MWERDSTYLAHRYSTKGHKYITKKWNGNRWVYTYDPNEESTYLTSISYTNDGLYKEREKLGTNGTHRYEVYRSSNGKPGRIKRYYKNHTSEYLNDTGDTVQRSSYEGYYGNPYSAGYRMKKAAQKFKDDKREARDNKVRSSYSNRGYVKSAENKRKRKANRKAKNAELKKKLQNLYTTIPSSIRSNIAMSRFNSKKKKR